VDERLQRLLDAEARAQRVIDAANGERQRLIDEALEAARAAEARFEAQRESLRAPFLHEGEERAREAVAELTRKYAERQRVLRDLASRHEAEAVDAALTLLLDPAR
jgi:vacuolar-type H+-ATPase subunit H